MDKRINKSEISILIAQKNIELSDLKFSFKYIFSQERRDEVKRLEKEIKILKEKYKEINE